MNDGKMRIPPIEQIEEELARVEAKRDFRRTLLNVAGILAVAAAIAALVATRLLVLIKVNGNSMAPTFQDGDIVILKQSKDVEVGDVVGFYYGGRILLKRVIGSAGDYIDIDGDGRVYVNGRLLDEPYLDKISQGKCEIEFPYKVPENRIFVLGDNREVSIDSRTKAVGCIEDEQIAGRVVFQVWPLGRAGIMR